MKCPDCENGIVVGYFACMADGSCKPRVEITCPRCHGTMNVPDEMPEWIEAGKRLRELRLSMQLGLRKAAEKLGVVPSYLSFAEQGTEGYDAIGLMQKLSAIGKDGA